MTAALPAAVALLAVSACAFLFVALQRRQRELQEARRGLVDRDARLAQGLAERAGLAAQLHARELRLVELQGRVDQAVAERAEAGRRHDQLQARLEARLLGLERTLAEEARARAHAEARLAASDAELRSERAQSAEKLELLAESERRLTDTFQALSGKALEQSAQQLLHLAEGRFAQLQEGARGELSQQKDAIDRLVGPVREQLESVSGKLHALETARLSAYVGLSEQVRSLAESQVALRGETQRLVAALRAPQTRGRWAELHLRRVVELAGLQQHCDFVEQATVTGEGGTVRPDMVVRLPGGSQVVIDAKAPLLAWLSANEAGGPSLLDDEQRRGLYRDHARQVRQHVVGLSDKLYWSQFDRAPDFVVLFLPTEAVLGAALEADPELQEEAIARRVLLATPMTLIALLRTVAYGWRQDGLAENAREISEQGKLLYERLALLASRLGNVGRHLRRSVDSFNETVGTLESRVLPAARKLKESQAVGADAELPEVSPVDAVPRDIQSDELLGPRALLAPGEETAN